MDSTSQEVVGAAIAWLMEQAIQDTPTVDVLCGLGELLSARGVPLWRVAVARPMLHPMNFGTNWVWERGVGIRAILQASGPFVYDERWTTSPYYRLVTEDLRAFRHRLDGAATEFALFDQLHGEGATDYLGFRVPMPMPITDGWSRRGHNGPDGIVGSWTTDAPGGWTDRDVEVLRALEAPLAVIIKADAGRDITRNVLTAYLGAKTGERVLRGAIRRGDYSAIDAVIWFSDLRGSTPMAERMAPHAFFSMLNVYFEGTLGALADHGGEVLAYSGDGALVIFPIDDDVSIACSRALAAATEAGVRMAALNQSRREAGEPELRYGIGLHRGEVLFGNVGLPNRVQFTVIGPAANTAARVEGQTKHLGEQVLVSEQVAQHLDVPWRPCGQHMLRGVKGKVALFAPLTDPH